MFKKKKEENPYTRKLKTPFYIPVYTPPDIWNHIYGLASALGFIITIVVLIYNYNKADEGDYKFVVTALLVLLTIVLLIFFLSVAYFNNKMKILGKIPADFNYYKQEFEKHNIIINQISECSHIVTHYFRNLDLTMQNLIDKDPTQVTDQEIIKVVDKFDYFLINICTNIQSYFSQITDDNCSITIKLLNFNDDDDVNSLFAKTYFRDPVNFKKRKDSDVNGSPCSVFDNTAFSIIMNPSFANIYFAEDDLPDLYKNHDYKNPNSEWHKYYHSSLVVPISIVTGEFERKVLGFLSVDNFKGGLATNSNKEFLFFIADLLYLAFNKVDFIMKLAQTKNIQNEKIDRYNNWD